MHAPARHPTSEYHRTVSRYAMHATPCTNQPHASIYQHQGPIILLPWRSHIGSVMNLGRCMRFDTHPTGHQSYSIRYTVSKGFFSPESFLSLKDHLVTSHLASAPNGLLTASFGERGNAVFATHLCSYAQHMPATPKRVLQDKH